MEQDSERYTGSISKLNERFYGFIIRDSDGRSLFFHGSSLRGNSPENRELFKNLIIGQQCNFAIAENDKGPAAVDVVL